MSKRAPKLPAYRHYRPKNLGVVRIEGRDYYLGPYNSAESWEKYRRIVAEWLTSGRVEPTAMASRSAEAAPLTIDEMLLAFLRHAEGYYKAPDGKPSPELDNVKDALRPLRKLYGKTPAREFGPLALRAVRDEMIRSGLAQTTTNARVNRIRRAFRWAASVELIGAEVVAKLKTVDGLKRGRSEARDVEPVGPVPVEHVEAAIPFMPKAVAALVRVQLLTGCRAGEAMAMRGCDLKPGDPVWEFRPATHKNLWRGQDRVILLGPRAVEVVEPFLKTETTAYLFSPRDTVASRSAARVEREAKAAARQGKPPRRRKAKARHAEKYDRRSYRQAIVRACLRAGVPEWTPLQLRHTAGTLIRARYGLETAQAVLGHANADVTQIYAERDVEKARDVMREIG